MSPAIAGKKEGNSACNGWVAAKADRADEKPALLDALYEDGEHLTTPLLESARFGCLGGDAGDICSELASIGASAIEMVVARDDAELTVVKASFTNELERPLDVLLGIESLIFEKY